MLPAAVGVGTPPAAVGIANGQAWLGGDVPRIDVALGAGVVRSPKFCEKVVVGGA
jgi:hypothetical protein